MHKLNKFIPQFLLRIDKYLLENHPQIWVMKPHYILFFSAVIFLPVMLISTSIGVDFGHVSDVEMHFGWLMVPVSLIGILWGVRQFLFNSKKQYGGNLKGGDLSRTIIYMAIFGTLLLVPFVHSSVLNYRISHSISDEELAVDINALNVGDLYFFSQTNTETYEDYYYADYSPWDFSHKDLLRKEQLIEMDKEHRGREVRMAEIEAFTKAYRKYGGKVRWGNKAIVDNFMSGNRYRNSEYDMDQYEVYGNIRKIANAKSPNVFFMNADFLKALLLAMFYFSGMMIIFRNANWKHFVIAASSAILLPPIILLSGELLNLLAHEHLYHGEEYALGVFLLCILFTGIQVGMIPSMKKFSGFKSVCLILFNAVLPFVPIVALITLDQWDHFYITDDIGFAALFIGAGIHLFVGIPIFERLYKRLQALPA